MTLQKIFVIAIVAIFLFVAGGFVGYSYCKRSSDRGVIKQQKEDATDVLKHEDKKAVVKKNVDEKIKTLNKVVDTSGCLDADSPNDYLNKLLDAENAAQPFSD